MRRLARIAASTLVSLGLWAGGARAQIQQLPPLQPFPMQVQQVPAQVQSMPTQSQPMPVQWQQVTAPVQSMPMQQNQPQQIQAPQYQPQQYQPTQYQPQQVQAQPYQTQQFQVQQFQTPAPTPIQQVQMPAPTQTFDYVFVSAKSEPLATVGYLRMDSTTGGGCAACGNAGSDHGGFGLFPNRPVLTFLNSYGFCCGSSRCAVGCGNPCTFATFVFGSCRSFFIETCGEKESHHILGHIAPGPVECPHCR